MYHDDSQIKEMLNDVRDMYDEDTYQKISDLIEKYLSDGYLSKEEEKTLFQLLRRTNKKDRLTSLMDEDSDDVEKCFEELEYDSEKHINSSNIKHKSALPLPHSVLMLILLIRKLLKDNEKKKQHGIMW